MTRREALEMAIELAREAGALLNLGDDGGPYGETTTEERLRLQHVSAVAQTATAWAMIAGANGAWS